MAKGPNAFRTISEAADELGVPQHVLRFWETKFSFIRPMKRAGRAAADVDLIIVATTTADLTFPATAAIVQRKLGCPVGIAFDVQAVC